MNAGKRSISQAVRCKAMGLTPGETDLRIYLKNGKLIHIELKTAKGRLSPAQGLRHQQLRALGHTVHVVQESDPDTGSDIVGKIVLDAIKEATNVGY